MNAFDVFALILAIVYGTAFYSCYIYGEIGGKYREQFAAFILCIATPACFVFFMYNYAIMPYSKPKFTTGTVTGTYYARGAGMGNTYIYQINGVIHEGNMVRSNYEVGDTLSILYDSENPSESKAAYKLYWYVNPSLKKYWRIHDNRFKEPWP